LTTKVKLIYSKWRDVLINVHTVELINIPIHHLYVVTFVFSADYFIPAVVTHHLISGNFLGGAFHPRPGAFGIL
jgi:hypothetical protein